MIDSDLRAKVTASKTVVTVETDAATIVAGDLPLVLEQGRSFVLPIDWKHAGVLRTLATGWTAKLKVKRHPTDTTALVSLTESSGITLADTSPNIKITISSATTAGLSAGHAMYELVLTDSGGNVTPLLRSQITITPRIAD